MPDSHDNPSHSIDALSAAFFGSVSFAPGDRPDYANIRSLFVPRGVLFKGVPGGVEATSVEEFIAPRQKSFEDGSLTEFRETELSASTTVFGSAAHRLSYYDKA